MNKKGFTLVELMISMVIFMGVLLVFFYIVKNTVLFVNFYKQEITLFNNVNLIKLKINESFHHDKITLLPTQELSMTGIYSIKDKTVLNNQKIYSRDVLSFEYEDKTSS